MQSSESVDRRRWTAIRSPVAWALLGLVIQRNGYGYELVKRFERVYDAVLPIKSDWHIYRALDGLKIRGLIEEVSASEEARADGARQPKPRYRATEEGVRRYADWLVAYFGPSRRQSQLFVRQLGALAARPTVALAVLDRYERCCLDEHTGGLDGPEDPSGLDAARLVERLAAEEQRLFLAWILPWIHFARAQIEALSGGDTDTHGDASA